MPLSGSPYTIAIAMCVCQCVSVYVGYCITDVHEIEFKYLCSSSWIQDINFGIQTLISGPPSIPLNLRLNDCDESVRTLTLVWDKPASNGGSAIVQYGLTVEPVVPQCSGICYVDANTTKFQFGPLNTNTQYTFTVHADNCNATQQGDQNNITVFYGGEYWCHRGITVHNSIAVKI